MTRTGHVPAHPRPNQPKPVENETGHFTVIPSQYGYVELAVRLLKSQIVTREAMKASSGKSALNGNVGTANESRRRERNPQ